MATSTLPGLSGTIKPLFPEDEDPNKPKTFSPLPVPQSGTVPALQTPQNQPTQPGGFDPNAAIKQNSQNLTLQAQGAASKALGNTRTTDLVSNLTQGLLQNPQAGYDFQQNKTATMDAFNREQNQALEARRQKTADTANTGATNANLTDLALRTAFDRSQLGNQLDLQKAETERKNLIDALTAGRQTAGTEQADLASKLAGLTSAKAMSSQQEAQDFAREERIGSQDFQTAMKGMDITAQKELTELKAKVDSDALMKTQDFEKGMAELQNQYNIALADKDTAKQMAILNLTQQFQAAQTEKIQQYQTAERIATQAFSTTERLSEQDFATASKYLDQKFAEAQKTADIEAQKFLFQKQAELEIAKQTSGFSQEQKMAYLNSELADARATGDFERQKALNQMAIDADFQKLESTQGFEAAQNDLNRKLETAIKDKDIVAAEALQRNQLKFNVMQLQQQRDVEQAKLALEKQGMDSSKLEANFNQILALEESGAIAPGASAAYLQNQLQGTGVTLEAPDPLESQKAIDAYFNDLQYQFLQTHPEYKSITQTPTAEGESKISQILAMNLPGMTREKVISALSAKNPELFMTSNSINAEGTAAFNKFMNDTLYSKSADGTTTWNAKNLEDVAKLILKGDFKPQPQTK